MRLKIALWLLRPLLLRRKNRIALYEAILNFFCETYYEDNAYNHLYNMISELFDASDVDEMSLKAMEGGVVRELRDVHSGIHFKVDEPPDEYNVIYQEARKIIDREEEMASKASSQKKFTVPDAKEFLIEAKLAPDVRTHSALIIREALRLRGSGFYGVGNDRRPHGSTMGRIEVSIRKYNDEAVADEIIKTAFQYCAHTMFPHNYIVMYKRSNELRIQMSLTTVPGDNIVVDVMVESAFEGRLIIEEIIKEWFF